jgi:hypothetical protein
MSSRAWYLTAFASALATFLGTGSLLRAEPQTIDYYFMGMNGDVWCGDKELIKSWTVPEPIPPLEEGNSYWLYEKYQLKTTYNEIWGTTPVTYDPGYQRIVVERTTYGTRDDVIPSVYGSQYVPRVAEQGGLYWGLSGAETASDLVTVHSWWASYWPKVVTIPAPSSLHLCLGMLAILWTAGKVRRDGRGAVSPPSSSAEG